MGLIMLRNGLELERDAPRVRELDMLLGESREYREVRPGEVGMAAGTRKWSTQIRVEWDGSECQLCFSGIVTWNTESKYIIPRR